MKFVVAIPVNMILFCSLSPRPSPVKLILPLPVRASEANETTEVLPISACDVDSVLAPLPMVSPAAFS